LPNLSNGNKLQFIPAAYFYPVKKADLANIQMLPKFSNVKKFGFLAAQSRKRMKIIIGQKAAQGYGITVE
jgi:hypothetical protein